MGAKLVRAPADRRKGWHIPLRLNVDQIQAQNLQSSSAVGVVLPCSRAGQRTSAFRNLLHTRLASLARTVGSRLQSPLTRPCLSPRCRCRYPDQGCEFLRSVAPVLGAACLSGRRRRACGRCPCGPFRAAMHVRAGAWSGEQSREELTSSHGYW